MHAPKFLYVGQTKVISGMKKRDASTRNLHIVKKVNESLNIFGFSIASQN